VLRARMTMVLAFAGMLALSATMQIAPDLSRAATTSITGAVTVQVLLDSSGRGTFVATGAISDVGTVHSKWSRSDHRVRLTQSLEGGFGTLVVDIDQVCGRPRSTWRVVRGTGSYVGLNGGGQGGQTPCEATRRPLSIVYTGTVRTSPPRAIATPGAYAGWTAQNERVTFAVLPGGRSVGNIRVERLYATCSPPLDVALEPAFLSSYPIEKDGSFTATFANSTISGRFTGSGAAGTVAYTSSETRPYVCTSGSVSWTASTPPAPLATAPPGTYCGSTVQNRGVCLTLAPGGRVSYLRIEAELDCVFEGQRVPFLVAMGFAARDVPLRSNLAFEVLGSIEGNASGEYVARGRFDSSGKVTGKLSVYRTSYDDQEGRIYMCRDSSFGWQASRVP